MKSKGINIVSAPYSSGCHVQGVEKGPETICKLLEVHAECVVYPEVREKELNNVHGAASYCARLRDVNVSLLAQGEKVLTLGGDHTIGLGSVAASLRSDTNIGLLWIDAHTDINTERTTITGNLHGLPVAALLGLCESELNEVAPVHIKQKNIVYIGTRSVDKGEKEIIQQLGIKVYTIEDVRSLGFKKVVALINEQFDKLGVQNIHVSFDIDVIDPAIVNAVSVPEKDGLTTAEYHDLVSALQSLHGEVRAMDIVEYNAVLDESGQTQAWIADEIPSLIDLLR